MGDDRYPRRLLAALAVAAVLSLVAGLAFGEGAAFGLYAGLGLAGVGVFALAARALGVLLGRPADYYER